MSGEGKSFEERKKRKPSEFSKRLQNAQGKMKLRKWEKIQEYQDKKFLSAFQPVSKKRMRPAKRDAVPSRRLACYPSTSAKEPEAPGFDLHGADSRDPETCSRDDDGNSDSDGEVDSTELMMQILSTQRRKK